MNMVNKAKQGTACIGNILFVDDDSDEHYLFKANLDQDANHVDMRSFYSGAELLSFLSSDEFRTSITKTVVLLDLNMPSMSGIEVLENISKLKLERVAPVVIYSNSSSKADVKAAYDLGAHSYIAKPSSDTESRALLKTLTQYWFHDVELI
jgi:CheY-like chemotaxis protein